MKKFLVFSSDNNYFQQSTVSSGTMANIQDVDLFCQSTNQRYFVTQIDSKKILYFFILYVSSEKNQRQLDDEIKQQNYLISHLKM